jgi:hypothetical protein
MTIILSPSGISVPTAGITHITANNLIESAALKLGAKATGESLTASEADDSLNILNSMVDSMTTDGHLIYQIGQEALSWSAGNATRTIGNGGDLNTNRPIRIESGTFFRDGSTDYVVEIVRDRSTYDRLCSKTDSANVPSILYYEPATPMGILYAYPVPSSTVTLYLNTWTQLQSFPTLTDVLSLPTGYRWFLEHNLAVALSPVFSLPVQAWVEREAEKSRRRLERINHRPIFSRLEMTGSSYDIMSDS